MLTKLYRKLKPAKTLDRETLERLGILNSILWQGEYGGEMAAWHETEIHEEPVNVDRKVFLLAVVIGFIGLFFLH